MALQTSIDNTDWAIVSFFDSNRRTIFQLVCKRSYSNKGWFHPIWWLYKILTFPASFVLQGILQPLIHRVSRTTFSNSELVLFRTFSILWGLLGILPSFHNHNNQCIGLRTKWFIITIITLEWSSSPLKSWWWSKSAVVWQPGHHEMVERSLAEWGIRFLDGVQGAIICNINVHRMIDMTIIV